MKVRAGGKSFEIDDSKVRGALPRRGAADSVDSKVSALTPAPPKYDSKWEERYATVLDLEQKAGAIVKWWYHPFTMRLPGGARYTPDFLVQHHGHIQVVDVKGYHKNIREAMLRIKVAAAIYTCYTWDLAKWNGKDFTYQRFEVDPW